MITILKGPFRLGSTKAERDQAYEDYLATSGRDTARELGWFEREPEATTVSLPAYRIDLHPVTQRAFAEFVVSTNARPPHISAADWRRQGFVQNYEQEVARFNWTGASPPNGRERHPVVLVPWAAAAAYCKWRGRLVGATRRLPSASEFEKAARGPGQSIYPWGNTFDATRLNSAVKGPRDTTEIESFTNGNSALGASDVAGNVFQWTSTPWPHGKGRMTVKGSAWDDQGGLGRAAAAHGRRTTISHAIVGFRCAGPA